MPNLVKTFMIWCFVLLLNHRCFDFCSAEVPESAFYCVTALLSLGGAFEKKHLLFCTAWVINENVLLPFFFAVARSLCFCLHLYCFFFLHIYLWFIFVSVSSDRKMPLYFVYKNLGKLAFVKMEKNNKICTFLWHVCFPAELCFVVPPGGANEKRSMFSSRHLTWTVTIKWWNLLKTTSELSHSAGITTQPVYSCFPWLYTTRDWGGQLVWHTMADLGAVAERHPRALSPSVHAPGIYSWCGWVEGPWQPKWSLCCLRAASSLCWLCPLQVSWKTDGLFKTLQFHLLFLSDLGFRADMFSIDPE